MKIDRSAFVGCLILWAAGLHPVGAQDDAAAPEKNLQFFLEIDAWNAQPLGLEYEPATVGDPDSVVGPEIIEFEQEPETAVYYRAGISLGPNVGEFKASWYEQDQQNSLDQRTASIFGFGESLAYPLFAGYENDGLADGFTSTATTGYSELRFDFRRIAFRSDRLTGKWFVGVRRVTHDRALNVDYYALAPSPPTVPPTSVPRPDLLPQPDQASISSEFIGRGIEGGMDFHVPLSGDRFALEAGFGVAVLRGHLDASYSSTNSLYLVEETEGVFVVAKAPYDYFYDPSGTGLVVDNVTQASSTFRLTADSRTTVSPVIDLYLGFRARIWKALELVVGWRSTYYGDVGVDLRPKSFTVVPTSDDTTAVNFVDVDEVDRSVDYQGAYLGVAFSF
ncbi:MAG TPA: hypothetical protein VD788_16470 [Candidatus Polarisedimenticolaceae bacterium]|nr:hypothetical protein [Candidatus Polarisedimenticolaceae bacterium]